MLRIYEWEWKQFPWQWAVQIKPEYRRLVTQALAKHWGLGYVEVVENKRSGGHAWVWPGRSTSRIALPAPKYRHSCPLGLIVHELAHVYDCRNNGGTGHRASFKTSLIKLQVEVRAYRLLPPIFNAIRVEKADAKKRSEQACATAIARAGRLEERRIAAHSPAGKLQRVQERAKRLRTRIKRLSTALRKAERQERRLERLAAPMEIQEGMVSPL